MWPKKGCFAMGLRDNPQLERAIVRGDRFGCGYGVLRAAELFDRSG